MVDIRRKNLKVREERRIFPRLEFHCKATIRGIGGVVNITDISLGGFFFELRTTGKLKMGQIVEASISLPTEERAIRVRARFVNQTDRGVGCEFISLSSAKKEAVHHCFETFRDTIPIS